MPISCCRSPAPGSARGCASASASTGMPASWCSFARPWSRRAAAARADIDLVFDLAVRLGLGNHFWHGNVAAALDHHLEPSGLNLEAMRAEPRGIRVPLETAYRKYRHGGFATPSGRIEIISGALQEIGDPPLPEFREPVWAAPGFPMTLTSAKTPLYCHSQHRNLAALRRLEPDPVAEISPLTAAARDVGNGDWVAITTPRGRVRA